MTTLRAFPVTIVEPQLQQLQLGRLTCLYRPCGGLLEQVRPGDLLWVREPFHLHHKWNGLSPTAAAKFGAAPRFVADGASEEDWDLGPRRFARNLLRAWHRQHLRVLAVGRCPVQAIPPAALEQQGFRTSQAFAAAWDRNLSLNVGGIRRRDAYHNNPQVLVIEFNQIRAPLPLTTLKEKFA